MGHETSQGVLADCIESGYADMKGLSSIQVYWLTHKPTICSPHSSLSLFKYTFNQLSILFNQFNIYLFIQPKKAVTGPTADSISMGICQTSQFKRNLSSGQI